MPFKFVYRGLLPAAALVAGAAVAWADPAAECLDRSRSPEAMIIACDAAILEAPDDASRGNFLASRAWAHRQLGSFDVARADTEKAVELAPQDADGWIERGYLLREEGDLEGAVQALEEAVSAEPEYARSLLVAMDILADAGEYERCLDFASTAIELAPERPHTWAYRGRCFYETGEAEAAVEDYRKAQNIGLDEAFLPSNLALALIDLGRYAEAEEAARSAVALDPADWGAQVNLLDALIGLGKYDEAQASYEAGEAALPPEEVDLANDMAWLLYLAGEYDRALAVIEPWIEAHPELTENQVWEVDTFAHVLAATGRAEEAAAEFQRAATLGGPEKRSVYEAGLRSRGLDPGADEAAFRAALLSCAQMGSKCQLDE